MGQLERSTSDISGKRYLTKNLTVGGVADGDGTLKIFDANGSEIVDINKSGILINDDGTFDGAKLKVLNDDPNNYWDTRVNSSGITMSGNDDFETSYYQNKNMRINSSDGIANYFYLLAQIDVNLHDAPILKVGYTYKIAPEVWGNTETVILHDSVSSDDFINTSDKEQKENIKSFKQDNKKAMDIINNGDIYNYNYKGSNKKRYGLVIGKDYNAPSEIISERKKKIDRPNKDGKRETIEETFKGISLYSMCSIMWEAIKEQDKRIKELEEKIEKLTKKGV